MKRCPPFPFLLLFACDASQLQEPAAPPADLAADGVTDGDCELAGLCGPPIDVMTWNLERFPASDVAASEAASLVDELGADLIGFQEISDAAAFDDMLAALPDIHGFVGAPGYYTSVAIAYRRARLRVLRIEDLFEDDRWLFPRPVLAVTFEVDDTGERLTVAVVHLKAQIDETSEGRRRAAMVALEAWIRGHRDAVTPNVIVVGDYNDKITDGPEDDIFLPFRTASYRLISDELAERDEHSYIPFSTLIDHIVATDRAAERFPVQSVHAVAAEDRIDGYLDLVSDHRPVLSRHIPILSSP